MVRAVPCPHFRPSAPPAAVDRQENEEQDAALRDLRGRHGGAIPDGNAAAIPPGAVGVSANGSEAAALHARISILEGEVRPLRR
jgi:hypothetical protein